MTRDLDDDAISQLVRDTAGGWTMPPVRLDAPSWRERVRSPRARRVAAARGFFGRFGQAATAAVALTVVGALVAVVLTGPPNGPGKSPAPSPNATVGPTDGTAASILPKLVVSGELPAPANPLVATEGGFYAHVDLAAGSLGREFTSGGSGNAIQRQADGSVLCLCVKESARVGGTPTIAEVSLDHYAADGTLLRTDTVASFTGAPDPRDPTSTNFNYPPHVLTVASFTADGRFGLVGWSLRDHPAWHSGMLLVDLVDGVVLDRLELPDVTTGDGSGRRVVQAPEMVGDAGSGRVVIARTIESWSSPDPQTASVVSDVAVFTVEGGAGRWANLAPVPGAKGCGYVVLRAGRLGDGGLWLACMQEGTGNTVVRRFTPVGVRLDDVAVRMGSGIAGDMLALNRDGTALLAWDPSAATLTRIDLATGATTTAPGGATAQAGLLTALGDWLAPTAAAKSILIGAIVVSPEGDRIYAIGVTRSAAGQDLSGSDGIYVFDAGTLAPLGHWPATADFVSLAVSRDGRFVYASGLPGVDAAGRQDRQQGASITVFDATDGSVRLLAGQLGNGMLTFPLPVLD